MRKGESRLLLTGATGFIGAAAVEAAIARGFEVHAVGHRPVSSPGPQVTYHSLDLLEPTGLARRVSDIGASHLLHLAWSVAPGQFWTSRDNFRWVGATLDLAAAFADAGGTRLVGVGTGFEYAATDGLCREGVTPIEPATPYAVAKDATRRLLSSFAGTAGIGFAWGRVFLLYGPRENPSRLVASVARSLLREQRALCSEGTYVRDFLHVRDTAAALVALTASDVQGAVNIASGQPLQVRQVVARLAGEIGRADLVTFGALPTRPEPPRQVADVTRLRDEIGWSPSFDLSGGLRDTIAWHRRDLGPSGNQETGNRRAGGQE